MMEEEIWKTIPRYKNLEASNKGRIRSEKGVRKYYLNPTGYLTINIKDRTEFVHRLIAETFNDNPLCLPIVNHLDGDKKNNNYYNLQWSTYSQNSKHAYTTGLKSPSKGYLTSNAKLNELYVIVIKESFNNGFTKSSIAKYFNVSRSTVKKITDLKNWKHVQSA